MSRLVIPSYTVIKDTREKDGHGWFFNQQRPQTKPPKCDGMIEQKLDVGDYSLVGYEDILSIERKEDFAELWVNYGRRSTFETEMEKMSSIKYKYILIESLFTPDHFDLSPPQMRTSVPGKALISWLCNISLVYGVHIVPVGSCGSKYAQLIFKNVVRNEKDRWLEI